MSRAKYHRQTPETETDDETAPAKEDGSAEAAEPAESSTSGPMEQLVEDIVESRTAELREELETLEQQIEEIDRFARVSLNERKVKQNEAKISDFSDSLTAFAEKAFNNINVLEDRLDRHALVLAAVVDSLDDDIDLSQVHRYQENRMIEDVSPDERLADALENAD
jgi:hypothetical protein